MRLLPFKLDMVKENYRRCIMVNAACFLILRKSCLSDDDSGGKECHFKITFWA